MSSEVVPTNGNQVLHPFPRGSNPQFSAARTGGGWRVSLPRRERRWTGVCRSTSSFKSPAAAVEKGSMLAGSFYELLGISEGDSLGEIKRAYKQMALKYHPDVSPPDQAEEYTQRFIEVQEAYETLSDPGRRALYDRDLARGLHFAFSSRRRFDEDMQRSRWRDLWQDQLADLELKARSTMKQDSEENLSWGTRMRSRRAESST